MRINKYLFVLLLALCVGLGYVIDDIPKVVQVAITTPSRDVNTVADYVDQIVVPSGATQDQEDHIIDVVRPSAESLLRGTTLPLPPPPPHDGWVVEGQDRAQEFIDLLNAALADWCS